VNCKKIKGLITCDYTDGQLDAELNKQVWEHLIICYQCRKFQESLRRAAVEPFGNLKEIRPADSVWEGIKESIEAEQRQQKLGIFAYLKNYLQPAFPIRNSLVPAMATVTILVIATVIVFAFLGSQMQITRYFQEQEEFLSSLNADIGNSQTAGYTGLGTAIEEYFL